MKMGDSFAVFILSHGRPNNIKTLKALSKGNYTGKIYIIIDDEDDTADEYFEKYGDMVIQFNKKEVFDKIDVGDTFDNRKVILGARNVSFDIAERLGLEYFLELDDDYSSFMFRFPSEDGKKLAMKECDDLDSLFKYMCEFLDKSGALTVAFAQGGDFIGGVKSSYQKKLLRKAMNTFFCKTDRRFNFVGTLNEDVNFYTTYGQRGKIIFTITDVMIVQGTTQANEGGLTDIYLNFGTYVKSFYSVMMAPSCVRICSMGAKHRRIHHKVLWDNCVPRIINESWKKSKCQ